SYEHSFTKICDCHILCPKSCVKSRFRAPSQNFKILPIPNVLAREKSYVHGFTKKCDAHKLCTKSHTRFCFDRFIVQRLRISKYSPFPMY
ncbi:hypothetical protein GW17_00062351, partial [Ensete ventricosum]